MSAQNFNVAFKFFQNCGFQPPTPIFAFFGWQLSDNKKIFQQFSDSEKFKKEGGQSPPLTPFPHSCHDSTG